MIKEIIIKKLVEKAFNVLIALAKSEKKIIKVSKEQFEDALFQHIDMVDTWSSEISFKDLDTPKNIFNTYVPLSFYFNPLKTNFKQNVGQEKGKVSTMQMLSSNKFNIIILGQPGAGKTTTMKYICQQSILHEGFFKENFAFPLLVRFRELSSKVQVGESFSDMLTAHILSELNIVIENTDGLKTSDIETFRAKVLINVLNDLNPILILDGFDEIPTNFSKDKILKEVEQLSLRLTNSRFILTCRSGDYNFHINNTKTYEISPLSKEQTKEFVMNWLKDEEKATDLFKQLIKSPYYDTTIRPLTLAHLCAIYEREGEIPEKPKTVYRKIVQLLIEEWNLQNRIKRDSKFANFEPDRKRDFLSSLAYELTTFLSTSSFSTGDLYKCYASIHEKFGLPIAQQSEVINEIETHNGLIVQNSQNSYEFSHKSLQEFLTAEYIVNRPNIPDSESLIYKLPNEMALAVTLSSEPTEYFNVFITERLLNYEPNIQFVGSFITRLQIEKPEFVSSSFLGVSFAQLYTRLFEAVDTVPLDEVFITLEESKIELTNKFCNLVKSIDSLQTSVNRLSEHYTSESFSKLHKNGQKIPILKLKNKNTLKNAGDNIFPEYLICPRHFFNF